jgi:hypothetical protein
MLGAGLMFSTLHCGLHVTEDGVDPLALGQLDAGCAAPGHHRPGLDARIGDAAKAGETIADDDRADAENPCDALENHWGSGGFTTP